MLLNFNHFKVSISWKLYDLIESSWKSYFFVKRNWALHKISSRRWLAPISFLHPHSAVSFRFKIWWQNWIQKLIGYKIVVCAFWTHPLYMNWQEKRLNLWWCCSCYLYLGRIHLVLNKTLMDDTSVKWAQIKTFFCLIQFCWNLVKL